MYKQQYVSTSSCWYVVYVSIYLYNIHTYVEHMYVYEYGQRPSAHVHMGQKKTYSVGCVNINIYIHMYRHIYIHMYLHMYLYMYLYM